MSLTLADYYDIVEPGGINLLYPVYNVGHDVPEYEKHLVKPIKKNYLVELYDKSILYQPLSLGQEQAIEYIKFARSGKPYMVGPSGHLQESYIGANISKLKEVGLKTRRRKQ